MHIMHAQKNIIIYCAQHINYKYNLLIMREKLSMNNRTSTNNKANNGYNKNNDIYMEINGEKIYSIANSIPDRKAFQQKWGILQKDLNNDEYNFIKLYTFEGYSIINDYFRKLAKIDDSEKKSLKMKCNEQWSK